MRKTTSTGKPTTTGKTTKVWSGSVCVQEHV